MIKTIIFDFDGVIAESVNVKTDAFAEMYNSYGDEVVKKVVTHHLNNGGMSRYEKFKIYHEQFLGINIGNDEVDRMSETFSGIVLNKVVKAPYVAGAFEFISHFYTQYNFYIASATPEGEIREIVSRRGLSGFFKAVYGAPRKKSDIVKEIIDESHISAKDAVYIGDALNDYKAAMSNSVLFIARISGNEKIFDNINCIKIKDLSCLNHILTELIR